MSVAAGQKRKESVTPVLYRIVHGSSSTSLNLIRVRGKKDQPRLFRKRGLYDTIIFKYPNFVADLGAGVGDDGAWARRPGADRPIETAIYVPSDPENPITGGNAIYLRQPNYQKILREFLGIDMEAGDDADADLKRDLAILEAIDDVPSLDPFLLKSRLETAGIPVEEGTLDMTPAEERAMRQMIERKIGPILGKAFSGKGGLSPQQLSRVLEAVWNPALPESIRFVEAFGIRAEECPRVFFALQGITYYASLFTQSLGLIKEVTTWLSTVAAQPVDHMMVPRYELERVGLMRNEVVRNFSATVRNMNAIFGEFDAALADFVKNDNPQPIRNFLFRAHGLFWRLGQAITSILNCHVLVDDLVRSGASPKFELVEPVLNRMRLSLTDKAETHRI